MNKKMYKGKHANKKKIPPKNHMQMIRKFASRKEKKLLHRDAGLKKMNERERERERERKRERGEKKKKKIMRSFLISLEHKL